ncbi:MULTISPECIES: hypothetical protein [Streptomyces]|uniref:hypothetical protein n=1 Tax=Streptomyces TaxID=1883 RepID=UPI00055AC36A|nr:MULTISPECIES: hypothetical protein [Streptomyces]MBZ6114579.1 hypothetical protein [Streptomyces olivaceus]MBZ6128432.1 hypothetical protein [Streptomyces olivaceus]MBZ6149284.1 hypothetical protein [Streptomyces olivaceus]MBZ6163196.1 hypothetical protein [Streptomyces olivaceus]MBZ6191000.1 hypothetical protein [Streptomyces olivaceus]
MADARSVVRKKKAAAMLIVVGVVAVGIGTSAAVSAPEDTGRPLEHRFDKSPQDLRDYWTPERIREAKQNGL